MDINQLLQDKKEKIQAAEEIRTRVYSETGGGEWSGDDTAKFDALMADAEKDSETIDRIARLDSLERSLDVADQIKERRTAPVLSSPRRTATAQPTDEDRTLALQGWIANGSAESREILTERHTEAAARIGVNLESRSFKLTLPPRAPKSLAELDADEKRVVTVALESPDTDGGINTVPDSMMRPLERALLAFGGMRQVSTIIRTNSGSDLPIPTNNDTSNVGAILAEGVEHTETDPVFSQLVLNAFKYTSQRVGMSVEYLQDNAVNAAGIIGEILGERIGRITNTHFTTGTGSGQPNGVVTAAADSGVTWASETAPTWLELISHKHSVDPAYRARGARWMFNDSTLAEIKKIVIPQYSGDTVGRPLWQAGLANGAPNTIDGDPYTINQAMATADADSPNSSDKAILYGDFSKYLIRDVRDVTLIRLDERYAELGVVAFLAFSRHDGDLLNAGTGPIKYSDSL